MPHSKPAALPYPKSVDIIFQPDEMELKTVQPQWSEEELLAQPGIFYLKDVAGALGIPSAEFKKTAKELDEQGKSSWKTMGIRKAWTHWQVRMTIFSRYFKSSWLPRIQAVNPDWDGNELLKQKGVFHLAEVCGKIPFTTHQIRYQVRRNEKARDEFGVWKDDQYNSYLVDMEIFSNWMKRIWLLGSFK